MTTKNNLKSDNDLTDANAPSGLDNAACSTTKCRKWEEVGEFGNVEQLVEILEIFGSKTTVGFINAPVQKLYHCVNDDGVSFLGFQ